MKSLLIALPGVLWKCYLEPHNLQHHSPRSIWQCNHQPQLFYPVFDLTSPFWFCLLFDSVSIWFYSLLPAPSVPYPVHSCSLKRHLLTKKGAVTKKKWGKRNNPRQTNKSREKALELRLIMDFMARLQYHFSLEIWGSLYLFIARLVCTIEPKICPLRQAVECIFKYVQRTQVLLLLALEKRPCECSCCWSSKDRAQLSA